MRVCVCVYTLSSQEFRALHTHDLIHPQAIPLGWVADMTMLCHCPPLYNLSFFGLYYIPSSPPNLIQRRFKRLPLGASPGHWGSFWIFPGPKSLFRLLWFHSTLFRSTLYTDHIVSMYLQSWRAGLGFTPASILP